MAGDRKAPIARLEQAIAAARADEPAPERLAQVRERIAQQSAGAQDASGSAAGPASAPAVKAATALGVLGLIVAGASWWAGTTQPSSAPALAPAPPRAPVHAVAEPAHEPVAKPPVGGIAPALRGGAMSIEPPVAPARKSRQPQAASPDPAATAAADSRAGALEPARKPAPVRAPSKATTRPPAIQAEAAAQKPQPPPAQIDIAPPRSAGAMPLQDDSELALLRAARAALAADPAGAIRLTDRHAQRFPAGVLREEREVIAIEALARTGRQADARARADRFAASFPSSVHRERVTRAVGQP